VSIIKKPEEQSSSKKPNNEVSKFGSISIFDSRQADTSRDKPVSHQDFTTSRVLGQGHFGRVLLVKCMRELKPTRAEQEKSLTHVHWQIA